MKACLSLLILTLVSASPLLADDFYVVQIDGNTTLLNLIERFEKGKNNCQKKIQRYQKKVVRSSQEFKKTPFFWRGHSFHPGQSSSEFDIKIIKHSLKHILLLRNRERTLINDLKELIALTEGLMGDAHFTETVDCRLVDFVGKNHYNSKDQLALFEKQFEKDGLLVLLYRYELLHRKCEDYAASLKILKQYSFHRIDSAYILNTLGDEAVGSTWRPYYKKLLQENFTFADSRIKEFEELSNQFKEAHALLEKILAHPQVDSLYGHSCYKNYYMMRLTIAQYIKKIDDEIIVCTYMMQASLDAYNTIS